MGKKRINLAYLIKNFSSNKEVAIVSVFSDNVQYKFIDPWMIELGESSIKQITAGTYTR